MLYGYLKDINALLHRIYTYAQNCSWHKERKQEKFDERVFTCLSLAHYAYKPQPFGSATYRNLKDGRQTQVPTRSKLIKHKVGFKQIN